jgi:hypothetical protein
MLSQECEVIVEPSAEASFPTMMLVQDSNGSWSNGRLSLSDWTPVQLTESKNRTNMPKNGKDHFLTAFSFLGKPELLIT